MREVNEALRQDMALSLFKRFAKLVGGAIVGGLLLFAGYLAWSDHRRNVAEERAEVFTQALDKLQAMDLTATSKTLAPLAATGDDGSQAAARLLQAGIAVEQGKNDEAAKIFAQVAASQSAPQPLRDLAKVREIALRFDALPPDQVISALKPLAVRGNAWFGSAGELVAFAYMKQGKNHLAGPLFAAISREKDAVPETIRQRARMMAGLIGTDAVDDVNEAAAGAPPPSQ